LGHQSAESCANFEYVLSIPEQAFTDAADF
jgi:hypothetical protein